MAPYGDDESVASRNAEFNRMFDAMRLQGKMKVDSACIGYSSSGGGYSSSGPQAASVVQVEGSSAYARWQRAWAPESSSKTTIDALRDLMPERLRRPDSPTKNASTPDLSVLEDDTKVKDPVVTDDATTTPPPKKSALRAPPPTTKKRLGRIGALRHSILGALGMHDDDMDKKSTLKRRDARRPASPIAR